MKQRALVLIAALCLLLVFTSCNADASSLLSASHVQTLSTTVDTTVSPVTLETIRAHSYADLTSGSPSHDAACYTAYRGFLNGVSDSEFAPHTIVTRAVAATALYRMDGKPTIQESTVFSDVSVESWYADAVSWASQTEVMNGTTEQTFSPFSSLTRSQLAVVLYRAAAHWGYPLDAAVDLSAYPDAEKVPSYAREAMAWALEHGIFRATVGSRLEPRIAVSRIQLAQALTALCALSGEDTLAAEILAALPSRDTQSAARTNHDTIQNAIDAAAKKYGAAGIQVAVIEGGEVTDTYAYGWATKNTDPMTTDHKIRIASISKVVVGLNAMLLCEDGIVNLDASIGDYWRFPVVNPTRPDLSITLRSLLTHTSSIINAGDDVSRAYSSVKSKLGSSSGFSKLTPGSIGSWSYNNYAYGVLGMTLELAANRTTDDILREKLYTAMDIDASFASGDLRQTQLLSTIYRSDGSIGRSVATQKDLHTDPTPGATGKYFAGGLTISVSDLAKLFAMLAGDGRYEGVQLISEESVALMESCDPHAVPGGSYQGLALRYWPALYGRTNVYYHTGSAYGVYNCASYDSATGDGVIVLTTGASGSKDDYGIYKICAEISDFVYRTIA
ncbi:MAG: serine hydrolase [Oscillospiraceae bacterium]|nr:serine hydrolase [Oscillospiraceae bacterium]